MVTDIRFDFSNKQVTLLTFFTFFSFQIIWVIRSGLLRFLKMSNSFRPRSGYTNTDRYSASLPVMKMRLENEIIRKREAESRRSETARSNDKYFQNCNLQNEKFDEWTSPRSAQLSHRQSKIRESEIDVETRRKKLKKLYQEDRLNEEQAFQNIQKKEEMQKWENMKEKVQHFRHSKSVKLNEFVENREHEQWKSTSASFRAFESELKKQQQQEMWTIQLQQREQEKIRLLEEKKREAAQMERLIQEERKRDEIEQKMELEKKQQCRKDLDEQVELLRLVNFVKFIEYITSYNYYRSKDFEANEKRREHDNLMAEAAALEVVREEIQKKEEDRAKRKQNGYFHYVTIFSVGKIINFFFQGVPYKATFSEAKATFQRSGR